MRPSVAVGFLRRIYAEKKIEARGSDLIVRHRSISPDDVGDCMRAIAPRPNSRGTSKKNFHLKGNTFLLSDEMFQIMKRHVYSWDEGGEHVPGHMPLLPSIFIGSEKTQVRQIPLVSGPPYPFRFLLELGGMIVLAPGQSPRDVLGELEQYLNNFPQFQVKVALNECPDGTVAIHTYWFNRLLPEDARNNINVPQRRRNRLE